MHLLSDASQVLQLAKDSVSTLKQVGTILYPLRDILCNCKEAKDALRSRCAAIIDQDGVLQPSEVRTLHGAMLVTAECGYANCFLPRLREAFTKSGIAPPSS